MWCSAGLSSSRLPHNFKLSTSQTDNEEERQRRKRIPAVWQLMKDNAFGHRKRKIQDEDDIMICSCRPTWRGGDGCGPDCINRMLCIECSPVRSHSESLGYLPRFDRLAPHISKQGREAALGLEWDSTLQLATIFGSAD